MAYFIDLKNANEKRWTFIDEVHKDLMEALNSATNIANSTKGPLKIRVWDEENDKFVVIMDLMNRKED